MGKDIHPERLLHVGDRVRHVKNGSYWSGKKGTVTRTDLRLNMTVRLDSGANIASHNPGGWRRVKDSNPMRGLNDDEIGEVEEALMARARDYAMNGRELVDHVAQDFKDSLTREQVVEIYNDALSKYGFPSAFRRTR